MELFFFCASEGRAQKVTEEVVHALLGRLSTISPSSASEQRPLPPPRPRAFIMSLVGAVSFHCQ